MDASTLSEEEEGVGMLATKRLAPLIIGQVLATIITLAVLVVVARMLGTALYGLYAFAFGYQAFIDGVVAWGIGVYYGRELAKNTHDRDVKGIVETLTSGFVIALPIAIILTLIGIGFSGVVANSWFSSLGISQSSLILVSPISFFIVIQSSIYMALIALRRSGLGAIVVVTTDVLQLVSIVLLIMAGYGVNGAIGGMLFGYAVGTVLAAYFLYVAASKYGKLALRWPKMESVRLAWRFSLPVAVNNFLNTGMQNFGIVFLGLFVAAAALGNYGVALKGAAMLAVVYGTINNVLVPTFSDAYIQKKKAQLQKVYNKIIIYAMIPAVAILVYIAALSAPSLFVLVSGSYSTAPIFLALLSIGMLLNLFGAYLGNLLIARGYTKELLLYNFYATIIELISLIVLVVILPTSLDKIIGAIVASFFIGNIAATLFFVNGAKKVMGIVFDYKKMAKLALASIVLGLVLWLFYLGSVALVPAFATSLIANIAVLVVGFVIMMIVFPVLIAVFDVMDSEDVQSVKKAVAKHAMLRKLTNAIFSYVTPFLR